MSWSLHALRQNSVLALAQASATASAWARAQPQPPPLAPTQPLAQALSMAQAHAQWVLPAGRATDVLQSAPAEQCPCCLQHSARQAGRTQRPSALVNLLHAAALPNHAQPQRPAATGHLRRPIATVQLLYPAALALHLHLHQAQMWPQALQTQPARRAERQQMAECCQRRHAMVQLLFPRHLLAPLSSGLTARC